LLDEPTNHLDLETVMWLENWLRAYPGTLLLISHDRDFLDATINQIAHVANCGITLYTGNYEDFERQKAERLAQQQSAFQKQQREIAHLQSFIDRFKAKATKAKQAQSRVKALERMEMVAATKVDSPFTFSFRDPESSPNPLLRIEQADAGYGATPILRRINLSIQAGSRIGLLGLNGAGKSTLIKLLAGEMAPLNGQRIEGKGLKIGYFAQHQLETLRPDESPLWHLQKLDPNAREADLRSYLGGFDFVGDNALAPVGPFSGGEKSRLALALLIWQRPNLLLLDEPTNHLDLATREALSMALNEFEGTVMLVSHDRALLRAVCDEFWMVGRGAVGPFDGDLDDYQRYLLDEARRLREEARAAGLAEGEATANATQTIAPSAPSTSAEGQNSSEISAPPPMRDAREQRRQDAQARQALAQKLRPLKQELERIDRRLAELAQERQTLEQRLTEPLAPADIADCGRRLKAASDETATLEERWLELSTELDGASA
ncbi:MAG TPA: ATP-binding cassette domain-containing protein, partial [Giesbergeria sp.]|nr:ATP-binding cassette domain-containing protein [Giesbergeria sp.]